MTPKVQSRAGGIARPAVPAARARCPFVWLEPSAVLARLPADAEAGLPYLQILAGDGLSRFARDLVDFSFVALDPMRRKPERAPGIGILNRRRRAARLWILAVLRGDVTSDTLHALTRTWLPHLAGTGPEAHRAARVGRACVEFLRGAITAFLFDEPDENLVRRARALHALETVLGMHLQAIRAVAAGARARS
jgi:hypothetical protein